MSSGSTPRIPLIRVVVATAGIIVLALVWSRLWSGESQPMAAGESAVPVQAAGATPVETAVLAETTTPSAVSPELSPAELSPDEKLKAQLIGIWLHTENGEQWIENRPDGTARMLLKLDFVSSLLYGQMTHMDLTWDVRDGILSHTVVGGRPSANVDKLVKDFGTSRDYTIREMTPERMLLESKTGKEQDQWTRTPAPKEWVK